MTADYLGLSKEIYKVVEGIHKRLQNYQIISRDMTIKAHEEIGELSLMIDLKKGTKTPWNRKVEFPSSIRNIRLRSIVPTISKIGDAIYYTDDKVVLALDKVDPDVEQIMIDFEYDIQRETLDSLVKKNFETEPLETEDTYWLHAQLKHPNVLKTKYYSFDIRDIEVKVEVTINNDVKVSIPENVKRSLETIEKWIRSRDRNEIQKLGMEHFRVKRKVKGDELDQIKELSRLCDPHKFKKFIEVKRPYRYGTCQRSLNYFKDLPITNIPRSMEVFSKTDLSIETPAKHGSMIYKRQEFKDNVMDIFS